VPVESCQWKGAGLWSAQARWQGINGDDR